MSINRGDIKKPEESNVKPIIEGSTPLPSYLLSKDVTPVVVDIPNKDTGKSYTIGESVSNRAHAPMVSPEEMPDMTKAAKKDYLKGERLAADLRAMSTERASAPVREVKPVDQALLNFDTKVNQLKTGVEATLTPRQSEKIAAMRERIADGGKISDSMLDEVFKTHEPMPAPQVETPVKEASPTINLPASKNADLQPAYAGTDMNPNQNDNLNQGTNRANLKTPSKKSGLFSWLGKLINRKQ